MKEHRWLNHHILFKSRRGFPAGSVMKNSPAMQETWVPSLGREDPLEEEMAIHSSILAMDRGVWQAIVHGGCKDSDMTEHLNAPKHC